MNNTNPLSNQSYINKDFQTIYPELLDLIKKLTYKWDPTISNESDPGVLLVKLNAIIADKNNYNIDKNLLECFPDSVTQDSNARKLYEQLGYNMHWYKSAYDTIGMKWKSEKLLIGSEVLSYPLPQFSMICDEDNETVYTTLERLDVPTDGSAVYVEAMQGVVKDYAMGTVTLINQSFLTENNRLYFPITNVAENGIFISDASRNSLGEYEFIWDRNDETRWNLVDNLHIQSTGTKCYKFGVDQTTNSCYIEFPTDISDLMGEGIFIKYLQTDGKLGNVASKRLTSFYTDIEYKKSNSVDPRETRTISKDIKLWNANSIVNGKDPETIDEAYIGYQRQVGTFDTLITLADYLNYIVNEDFRVVSNGVVADRTNDIQSSYKVVNNSGDSIEIKTVYDSNKLTPYSLKTYFLDYSDIDKFGTDTTIESQKATMKANYDKSFNLKFGDSDAPLNTSRYIVSCYEGAKAIQHDFVEKLPNRPLFFKNKFALDLTIVPNTMVTQTQASEIERNVYAALYKNLISKNITFGKELTYEAIYDICSTADNRIKAIALDNINYQTYAVVYVDEDTAKEAEDNKHWQYKDVDGNTIKPKVGLHEIPVSINEPNSTNGETHSQSRDMGATIAMEVVAKNVLAGTTPMYDETPEFNFDIAHTSPKVIKNIKSATTYTEIKFNNVLKNNGNWTSDEKILDNESLILYSPSLIEVTSFSSGVKYLYFTTTEYTGSYVDYLPANRDLILERGQYLFIFRKEEDSKDAPYLYSKYGPGTILHSTTRLKTSSKNEDKALGTKLLNAGYGGEGQILGDLNDELYDISDTILSASKTITIKKINSAKLNDGKTNCYWITNHLNDNNEYEMKFEFADSLEPKVIDTIYQGGQIYASNFSVGTDLSVDESDELCKEYTLKEEDEMYIFEPVTSTITYTGYDERVSYFPKEVSEVVTNYRIVDKLTQGAVILCTGPIYKDVFLPTYDFSGDTSKDYYILKDGNFVRKQNVDNFNNVVHYERLYDIASRLCKSTTIEGKEVWTTLEWGEMSQAQYTPGGQIYYTPQYNNDVKYLKDTDITTLKNGYKIEKYKEDEINIGDSSSSGTSVFTYRLKTNEYFVYTSEQKDLINILEDGTTINIEVANNDTNNIRVEKDEEGHITRVLPITLKVKASLNTDDLTNGEQNTFKDEMWYVFNPKTDTYDEDGNIALNESGRAINLLSGMIPEIVENQIIKLGAGTSISVKPNSVTYKVPKEEGGWDEVMFHDPRYGKLKIDSTGVYRAKVGTDDYVLDPHALLNYNVRYKGEDEDSYTEVTPVEADGLSWNGYTILNINSGKDSPQKIDITHNQKITLTHITDDKLMTTELPIHYNDFYGISVLGEYFQLSETIILPGGENIDLTAKGGNGDIHYVNAYVYQMDNLVSTFNDFHNGGIFSSSPYGLTTMEKQDGKYTVLLNTPTALVASYVGALQNELQIQMILPIRLMQDVPDGLFLYFVPDNKEDTDGDNIPDKDDISVVLRLFNEKLFHSEQVPDLKAQLSGIREWLDTMEYSILPKGYNYDQSAPGNGLPDKKGVYYYELPAKSGMIILYSNVESNKVKELPLSIQLLPLFAYRYNEELKEIINQSALEDEVFKWDVNKDFDYTYQPLYDSEILNPLDGKEFFKRSHAFNKYVIPQISSIKIKTMNKRT